VDAVLTLGAPLQVVGRLPTGERFLFHERHERVAMDLWNPGTKVEDIPPPEHELTWTEETDISTSHEAGLTTDGIADLIRSAFDRYSQEASRR
jgi:hypothetical protein